MDNILDEFDALFDSPEVIFDFEKPLNTPPAKHQQTLPKLLSLSSKDCQPTCSPAKASTPVAAHLTEEAGTPDVTCEEELHRALEESKRFNQVHVRMYSRIPKKVSILLYQYSVATE